MREWLLKWPYSFAIGQPVWQQCCRDVSWILERLQSDAPQISFQDCPGNAGLTDTSVKIMVKGKDDQSISISSSIVTVDGLSLTSDKLQGYYY